MIGNEIGNSDGYQGFLAGSYDAAVIGAGHAGCEAALACARLGLRTVIFAINLDSIANMPCNPSIGGTAKGHLVREVDALGGEMGRAADATLIQSRMLNRGKGPAVHSLRAQIDRRRYQIWMKNILENQENLDIRQAEVTELIYRYMVIPVNNAESGEKNKKIEVEGLVTHTGTRYHASAIILTTGTYLRGKIIIGDVSYSGGPDGLFAATKLSASLRAAGIELMRFKTGTPARVNGRSINFNVMEEQPGDDKITPFSFENEKLERDQVPCWLTYTNAATHEVIRSNLHRSPLFGGMIEGIGPRYCPSIEDKVVRFAERERHQIFVEPMGTDTAEMYLQGASSSLPEDVQLKLYQTIAGLEKVSIMRSAYAIEYDCIDPLQLRATLEFKNISGLFSAGQVNGSSGYEEAAAQGLVAGINAAHKVLCREPVVIDRSQGYIGVLIDDLVTKGTNEPYRMMTSRAEYRLLLRQDNADRRLTTLGYDIGLISEDRYRQFIDKIEKIDSELKRIKDAVIAPSAELNKYLEENGTSPIISGVKLDELLRRPELDYEGLAPFDRGRPAGLSEAVKEQVLISVKYEGYIKRQLFQVEQFKKTEERKLPQEIDYFNVHGLSNEAAQKLDKVKPASLGQASRISGVSPADISVLVVFLERYRRRSR
ncbi:MAG: tRNA uridine-5-carboxymethylaminomethyl(34) synthesis enzyme MnmG [Clostridiales bacterium]|nr:tRNA uridine-5-carboxymethylaminomethyl(34) synthesis enzyme MnmG [Clostridiales bacterium]